MTESIINVKDLTKNYDLTKAVRGISFTVKEGEVFSMVGPNGAGKTTTVEICEGIRKATSGTVYIFGEEFSKKSKETRQKIGVLPQEYRSFERLTVKETLKYYSSLYESKRDIDEIIDLLELEDKKDELYMNLSGGLKQRVGVGMALVNDPELIFLDEPTTGLDPRSRRGVWDAIESLKKEGKTIFLTTHYMEEAEFLADRIAIMHLGKIAAQGCLDDLIHGHGGHYTVLLHGFDSEKVDLLGEQTQIDTNGTVSVRVKNPTEISKILKDVIKNDLKFANLEVKRTNLEEVFMNVTGTTIEEGDAA